MKLPIYQLDAFTSEVFSGNPAAVCPLESWLDDVTLQSIGLENNLSETAFFVATPGGEADFRLRWFTPKVEARLCGHATLASAYVIFRLLDPGRQSVVFDTLSGLLTVNADGDRLVMDFPARMPGPTDPDPALLPALGGEPEAVLATEWDYTVVFRDASAVRELRPNISALAGLDRARIIVTAPGDNGFDCVSRFFAPANGVPEDPATGSAHCTIIPYWAQKLGKPALRSYQASARGGVLDCELAGDRVKIAGQCALYLEGTIDI